MASITFLKRLYYCAGYRVIEVGSIWEKYGRSWSNESRGNLIIVESIREDGISYRYLSFEHDTSTGWDYNTFIRSFKKVEEENGMSRTLRTFISKATIQIRKWLRLL